MLPATADAAGRHIDFDDATAPCYFYEQVKLTTQYQSLGVVFSGPSAGTGGEILLESCSNFGVTGNSAPNFLAFNPGLDGEGATGPETLTFSPAANLVTFNAASASGGTLTLTAFDGSTQIAQSNQALSSALAPVSVAGSHITSVRIAAQAVPFVVDDLVWSSPPVAAADSYSMTQATTLSKGSPGVLSNDKDADGDLLTAQLVSNAAHGTAQLYPGGDFTYTPAPSFVGKDTFTYRAAGGDANSAPATVSISVAASPACTAALAAVRAAEADVEAARKAVAKARAAVKDAEGKKAKKKAKKKLRKAKRKLAEAEQALTEAQAKVC